MSKLLNAITPPVPSSKLALALLAGGFAASCGTTPPTTIDPEGFDGIGEETFDLLANPCTINTNTQTMSLSVRGSETLYVTLRAADNQVVAASQTAGGAECAVPTTYKIAITEDAGNTGVEKVFLDYINGPYAVGSTTAGVSTAGITIALGAGSSLVVRGSTGADKVYAGSTYSSNVLQYNWLNINGDTSPDIRLAGVTDIKVSTGIGADIISADGGNGTTGTALDATITFSAFGGPDADTLTGGKGTNTLDGGDGNDTFVQTATVGSDTVVGGKGVDTVDYSVRTTAVTATVCTTCSNDPSGCIAANTTCHGTADTAYTTCTGNAATALATCNSTANSDHATCTSACTPGDTTCTDACDATLASDLAACTATNTSSLNTCTSTRTSAYATCDATQTTCQAGATTAACAVCIADDGAAGEADTINDDVETVLGGKGGDNISAQWSPCTDAATVPTVKCTLKGNDGDDTIVGSAFADSIDGGNGNDTLRSGLGSDTLVGGAGIDTVSYAERTNPVKVSLDASKLWTAGQNGEVGENDSIATDIENLTGGAGNDSLRGSAAANIIRGGAGNDTIEGALGNDSLYGEAGADLVYGGAGNDMLVGGAGADTLVGGDGDDFLDASDSPATADTAIDCDGVNDSANTAGTSAGTSDALVKDSSDVGALRCEL